MAWLRQSRASPRLVLVVVCVALLLDNMLLTVVVPIIPTFLYAMEHPSPEPQTSERPPPSLAASKRPSPTPLSARTEPRLSSSTFSPLVSLFDNSTFSLQQVQPEALRNPNPTPPQLINETANASESSCLQDSVFLEEENVHVGLLFASKALIQLLVNPFVGPLTNRVGYHIPMFAGFIIMFVSTIMFAFSGTYALLFFARSLQGIGSSFSSVAGPHLYTPVTSDPDNLQAFL